MMIILKKNAMNKEKIIEGLVKVTFYCFSQFDLISEEIESENWLFTLKLHYKVKGF